MERIEVVPTRDRLHAEDGDHWDVIFQWTEAQSTRVTLTTDQLESLRDAADDVLITVERKYLRR